MPTRARFAAWAAQEPVLAGLTAADLQEVLLDDTGEVDHDRRDDLLTALIRLSRTDELAGVLLIICLLPGLRRKIIQHGWSLDPDEATSIALVSLWRRIRSYPLLRRPRKVAMNLLMDTAHDLIDLRNRELAWSTNTYLTARHEDRPHPPADEWSLDLLWDTARRAGVLSDREIALLKATRVHGLPIAQVAPLVGMSHDAARKARRRAVQKLKAWWSTSEPAA